MTTVARLLNPTAQPRLTGRTWPGVVALVVLAMIGLAGCGGTSQSSRDGASSASEQTAELESEEAGDDQAADESVCRAQAEPIKDLSGTAFPEEWPFPPQTVVYHLEDRGESGTIVTAVTATPFEDVLAFMNNDVVDAGFEIESGETEERDAEAEWRSAEYHGRWAIRMSANCAGETTIQVLAAPH